MNTLLCSVVFAENLDEALIEDLRSSRNNLEDLRIEVGQITRDDLKLGVSLLMDTLGREINEEQLKNELSKLSFLTLRTGFYFDHFLEKIIASSLSQEKKNNIENIFKDILQKKGAQFLDAKVKYFSSKEKNKVRFKIEESDIFYNLSGKIEDIILIRKSSSCKDNNCLLYSIIGDDADLLTKMFIASGRSEQQAKMLASNIMKVPELDETGLELREFSYIRTVFINRIERELGDTNSNIKNKLEEILNIIVLNTDDIQDMLGSDDNKNREILLSYLVPKNFSDKTPMLDGLFAVIFSLLYNQPVYLMSKNEKSIFHANDLYKDDIALANTKAKEPIYIYISGENSAHYSKLLSVDSYIADINKRLGPNVLKNIKSQIYTDVQGQEVVYNHDAQLDQLQKIKKEGKNLNLILGRGNKEIPSKIALGDAQNIWVYGNIDGSTLIADSSPHLWMNFNNIYHLRSIPDELFNIIAFDASVIKFFGMYKVSAEFYRMLKPGGKFFFDLSLSYRHLCLLPDKLENCIKSLPGEGQEKIFETTSGFRYFINQYWELTEERAPKVRGIGSQEPTPEERKEINARRDELIKNHLEQIFGPGQCVLGNVNPKVGFPIPENLERHLECTRGNN